MERMTVSDARSLLEELIQVLHSAYWDSNDIKQKDTIFDMVSMIYGELLEISKLSVHDYSMSYEPITSQFPACTSKFKLMQQNIDLWFQRSETAEKLQETLSKVINLGVHKAL